MITLTPEQIETLTDDEKKTYEKLLTEQLLDRSPLDMACVLDPNTKRLPHQELINETVTAFCQYRLYDDGPGPEPQMYYSLLGEDDKLKTFPALDINHVPFSDPDIYDYWYARPGDPLDRVKLRLGIAVPPRHGKSFLVSEWLPLWFARVSDNPDVVLATYSDDFAEQEWGVKARNKLVEYKDKLGYSVKNGHKSAAARQHLTNGGQFRFVGAGGAITGTGFQLGIIDDPFKNQDDALSQAERTRKGNWYGSTWTSRKTKKNEIIPLEIMMFTRWNLDDLSGRYVYNEDGTVNDEWFMLHLPALAVEEDDPLGRRLGQALCPQIMTRAELLAKKEEDPEWFACLYQGSPQSESDDGFGNFKYYSRTTEAGEEGFRLPDGTFYSDLDCVFYETVDLAATVKSRSDWSVIGLWAYHRDSGNLFLVKIVRERIESDTHPDWLTKHHDRRAKYMGIEDRTYGTTAIQALTRRGSFPVKSLKADRDKYARAIPAMDMCKQQRVWHPAGEPAWLLPYEAELLAGLTVAKHDDQIDVFAYAALEVQSLPAPVAKAVKPELTIEEKCWQQVERRQKFARRRRL